MHMSHSKGCLINDAPSQSAGMSLHEANRAKKSVETNIKTIENRIGFFKREEEKIWRDLEEVRRQAATIEDGRSRTLEKKLADRTIQQERELIAKQNRAKALASRQTNIDIKKRRQYEEEAKKRLAGEERRKASQDILRQKRMHENKVRMLNEEKVCAMHCAELEGRLKVQHEKANRLKQMREQHEVSRIAAENEVQEVESRLPQLEAEELVCLQRLQNSRIVTQSVLEELETSLGTNSSVTNLLRQKQRGQEHFDSAPVIHYSGIMEHEDVLEPDSLGHDADGLGPSPGQLRDDPCTPPSAR